MAVLEFWSDLHCPYAYLAAHRVRALLPEFEGRVEVRPMALSIEYVDSKPTPKEILDAESPLILLEAPDAPYRPWLGSPSAWPSTMWPAFEAVKCAERQGWRLALEMDWRIRVAFWARHEPVALRHVLLRLAGEAGLDVERFTEDFDSGACKRQVLDESRRGWDAFDMQVSPTFRLPSGELRANPAAPHVELDPDQAWKVVRVEPAPEAWQDAYRRMFEAAARA